MHGSVGADADRNAWASPVPRRGIRVAIASGKGGTGKTSVATSLAHVAAPQRSVAYLDCDVEAPNGAIFLNPIIANTWDATVAVPQYDPALCNDCGKCERICRFGAIVSIQGRLLLFPHLCHGCGGCWLVCRTGAMRESARSVGTIASGDAGGISFRQGVLDTKETASPAVIREVLRAVPERDITIIDAPPGVTCPTIEAVRGADVVVLVCEPTRFGLHDLRLAVAMVRRLGLPFVVVVNKARTGNMLIRGYCRGEGIQLVAEIPDAMWYAESYARGDVLSAVSREYAELMAVLLAKLDAIAAGANAVAPMGAY